MDEILIKAMVNLEDDSVVTLVKEKLKSHDPMQIFEDLRIGLLEVGELFDSGDYFLSDLIIAADIFKETSKLLEPYFQKKEDLVKAKILIGTVEGDMHDIGKNIIITLLRSEGYEVCDLGIDVSPEIFLKNVKEFQPKVVGLSGLLTSSKEPMRKIISLIKDKYENKDQLTFIVGGVAVNDDWIKDTGADYGTDNAVNGLKIINEVIKNI